MHRHLIHVEDDKPLRDLLAIGLKALEPEINLHQFSSADEALPYIMAQGNTIDVFILDIRLPGMLDGLALAQRIRDLRCPGYIIVTSAYLRPAPELLASLRCEYFPKPWQILQLVPKLQRYRLNHQPIAAPALVKPPTKPLPTAVDENSTTRSSSIESKPAAISLSCPNCGHNRQPDHIICDRCGTVLTAEKFHTQRSNTLQNTAQEKKWTRGESILDEHQVAVIQSGERLIVLPPTTNVILGCLASSQSDKEVVIDLSSLGAREKGVSRRHLRITRHNNMLYVTDLASTNGSWLNGHRMVPSSKYILRHGDELSLAKLQATIKFQTIPVTVISQQENGEAKTG